MSATIQAADVILYLATLADECEDEARCHNDGGEEHVNSLAVEYNTTKADALRFAIIFLEDLSLPDCKAAPRCLDRPCIRKAHEGRHFDTEHKGWNDPPWDAMEAREAP